MASYSSYDIDRLIQSIETLASTLSSRTQTRNSTTSSNRGAAPTRSQNNTNRNTRSNKKNTKINDGVGRELDRFGEALVKGTDALTESQWHYAQIAGIISKVTKGFGLVSTSIIGITAAATYMVTALKNNTENLQRMSHYGMTFSGNLTGMSREAAAAQLPLKEFSKLLVDNAGAAAVLGTKGIGDLTKGFRQGLHEFDMLNMTTSDLNEYMTESLKTQKSWGSLSRLSTLDTIDSMQNLAIETTKLSNLTGKNRMEILKDSQSAMQNHSLASRMYLLAGRDTTAFSSAAQKAVTYLSGMPGEAGALLSTAMAETIGKGTAEMSEFAQIAGNAGMGQLTGMFNRLNKRIQDGTLSDRDMETFREEFTDAVKANASSLLWAANNGNQAAKSILSVGIEFENLRQKELAELGKQSWITSMTMRFEQMIKEIVGDFMTRIYGIIDGLEKGLERTGFFELVNKIVESLKRGSESLSNLFQKIVTPERIEMLAKFTLGVIDGLGAFINMLSKSIDKFGLLATTIGGTIAAITAYKAATTVMGKGRDYIFGQKHTGMFSGRAPIVTPSGAMLVQVVGGLGGGASGGRTRGRTRGGIGNQTSRKSPSSRSGNQTSRKSPLSRSGNQTSRKSPSSRSGNQTSRKSPLSRSGNQTSRKSPLSRVPRGAKLGAGALVLSGAQSVVSDMDDFTGKGAVESGLNIASMAATGAMIGSMVPVIGTAVGGIAGALTGSAMELYDNFDSVKDISGKLASSASSVVSNSIDAIGGAVSFVGNWMGEATSSLLSTFGDKQDTQQPVAVSPPQISNQVPMIDTTLDTKLLVEQLQAINSANIELNTTAKDIQRILESISEKVELGNSENKTGLIEIIELNTKSLSELKSISSNTEL